MKIRLHLASFRLLSASYRLMLAFHSLLRACVNGIWLGLLRREELLEVSRTYYSQHDKYGNDRYNQSGLWNWEARLIDCYFSGRRRLLVMGAGGGRELLALARHGFEVDGVECNPSLVRSAKVLLATEGVRSTVRIAPPDTCPPIGTIYDGLVIGWGAYMLVQGRQRREALLVSLRQQCAPSAPLLLSFFTRPANAQRYRVIAGTANILRRFTGGEPVELGDDLEPEYVHYFTRDEIAEELWATGFDLVHFDDKGYGHAVAIARP